MTSNDSFIAEITNFVYNTRRKQAAFMSFLAISAVSIHTKIIFKLIYEVGIPFELRINKVGIVIELRSIEVGGFPEDAGLKNGSIIELRPIEVDSSIKLRI